MGSTTVNVRNIEAGITGEVIFLRSLHNYGIINPKLYSTYFISKSCHNKVYEVDSPET